MELMHASAKLQIACIDALMTVQMALLCPPTLALLLGLWLAVCMCICAVCLDVALAVVGLAIHVIHASPATHARAISCIMKACMRVIFSKLMIKGTVLICIISSIPKILAVGRDTPAINTAEYLLPGVTRWDGIPFHDFRLIWWVALGAALGNIAQDGWSLLQTARDQDQGGPTLGGTPAQRQQSQNRNQRLFGAMLNYIEPSSWVYRYAQRTFANNGRGLYNYLYVFGNLPYTSDERTVMENEWTDATMTSANIKYTSEAVFKWAEYVDSLADKLNKSERDKRVKFLAGFPASFDVMIVPERSRGAVGSYTHPANHPAHHPNAGNPHPLAGQPDIHATALAFYPEWARMIRTGAIRSVPRGMANRIDEIAQDEDDPEEQMYMARERITANTICGICGGAGHAGKVDGIGACLTARLNNRIPNNDLARFQYPPGYKQPNFLRRDDSNPSSSRRHHPYDRPNPNPRPKARIIEPAPSEDECSPDEQARYTSRINHRRPNSSRFHAKARSYTRDPRSRPRPHSRQARSIRDENDEQLTENADETQNVSQVRSDAASSDEDEHARLAVSFDVIEF